MYTVPLHCLLKQPASVIKYTEELANVLQERRSFLNQAETSAQTHTSGSSMIAGGMTAAGGGGSNVNERYDTSDRRAN